MLRVSRLAVLVLISVVAGCAEPELGAREALGPEPSFRRSGCVGCGWGPPVLNTSEVNGVPLDAVDLTGAPLADVTVQEVWVGTDPNNERLASVGVEGGILYGIGESGAKYAGADFIGGLILLKDNRYGWSIPTTMAIRDFVEEGSRSRYELEYQSAITEGAWLPTCVKDGETDEYTAILFGDLRVDPHDGSMSDAPGTLYFGCVSGAVGKAVMWGYAPWVYGSQLHQTATRMVRADYCGDGTSYTQPGNGLQLQDTLGEWTFADPSEATEAVWLADGVACLGKPRDSQYVFEDVQCANGHVLSNCEALGLADFPQAEIMSKRWTP